MSDSKIARYFLIGLLLVFLYLAVILVKPLFTSIILAFVFVFAFYPVYKSINNRLKRENLSATIMIIIIILIIVIPGAFIVNSLIKQSYSTYTFVQNFDFSSVEKIIPGFMSEKFDLNLYIEDIVFKLRNLVISFAPDLIGSIAETMLGLFVMFFIMFYGFKDGSRWVKYVEEQLPMKSEYTERLLTNTENVTKGILYGYVVTALIQGTLGGLLLFIFGIQNAIFWGFVMVILAAIPVVGTPIVWIPIGLIELYLGHYFAGIFILAFGFVVLVNIDNVVRPKLIGRKANVHPALVLVGVLGGLSAFGLIGMILGPLILSLLMVLFKFFVLEFEE